MFNPTIDNKLRGCDVVALRVEDVAPRERRVFRHAAERLAESEGHLAYPPKPQRLPMRCRYRFEANPMIPPDTHLQIGSLLFDGLDQIDLTGPFEARIPNATYRLYGKTVEPVRGR